MADNKAGIDYIMSFTDVTAVLHPGSGAGSISLPVSSITLSADVNSIPVIQLTLASFTERATKDSPITNDSTVFIDQYTELRSYVDKDEARLDVTIVVVENGETKSRLYRGWYATDVVVQNISVSNNAAPTLMLTAMHPVYVASTGTGWVPNVSSMPMPPYDNLNGATNILELYIACVREMYQMLLDNDSEMHTEDGAKCGDMAALTEALAARVEAAVSAIENYVIADDDLGFPFGTDEVQPLINYLWRLIFSSGNLWNTFTSTVLSEFELSFTYDFGENPSLLITPLSPWRKPELLISAFDTIAIPGGRDYVAGVVVNNIETKGSDGLFSLFDAVSKNAPETAQMLNCLGGYVCGVTAAPAERLFGVIAVMTPPAWLTDLTPPSPEVMAADGEQELTSGFDPLPEAAPDDSALAAIVERTNLWAEQVFLRLYSAGKSVTLPCRFLLFDDTRPGVGVTAKVMLPAPSQDSDKVIGKDIAKLACYVVGVTHVIDLENASAGTTVRGSYVRTVKGVPAIGITDLDSDRRNPLYET